MPERKFDYAIIGAGALGSLLAAHLVTNGVDVLLVDESDRRRAQIESAGVRVVGCKDVPTCRLDIVPMSGLAQRTRKRVGTAVLAVPPRNVSPTLERLREAVRPDTPLLSLVGGLGHIENISAWAGETVLGVVNLEARLDPSGNVEAAFHNFLWLGNLASTLTPEMRRMQRDLAWAGPTLTTKAILGMLWGKALYALESSLPAFVNVRPAEFFADKANRNVAVAVVREGIRIADALGVTPIAFDFFDPNLYRASNAGEFSTLHVWIDHAWQRHEQFRFGAAYDFPATCGLSWAMSPENPRTELGALLEDFQHRAREAGVDAPSLDALSDIARRVSGGEKVAPSNLRAAIGEVATS